MDLLQAFKDTPLWFQVVFGILQLSALYAAIKLLFPDIIRWCRMILQKLLNLINNIREHNVWINHKPEIQLMEVPAKISVQKVGSSYFWFSEFKILLLSNDTLSLTQVNISSLKLRLIQGSGIRKLSVALELDPQELNNTIELKQKGLEGSIAEKSTRVQKVINKLDLISAVDLDKPYKWEITGITARIHPLRFKILESFKGESK